MESPQARPPSTLRTTFSRVLFAASLAGLVWVFFTPSVVWPPTGQRLTSLLLWGVLVLGTGGSVIGDRHPRWRWALLIASGVLLIAVFVLLRGVFID